MVAPAAVPPLVGGSSVFVFSEGFLSSAGGSSVFVFSEDFLSSAGGSSVFSAAFLLPRVGSAEACDPAGMKPSKRSRKSVRSSGDFAASLIRFRVDRDALSARDLAG
ncbi:MAG: hypothetical protein CL481_07165 [Acidobacteria bacterium]|nr:hypothetical protein [Acidobacteriota bacterium]